MNQYTLQGMKEHQRVKVKLLFLLSCFLLYFVMSGNCIRVGGQQFDSFHDGREIPARGSHLLSVVEGRARDMRRRC